MVDPTQSEVIFEWGLKISVEYDLIYTTSLERLSGQEFKESWADWICRFRNVQLVNKCRADTSSPCKPKMTWRMSGVG